MSSEPPVTGDPQIDAALAELVELAETPLDEHLPRLAAAHDVLLGHLDESREQDRETR